jgi:hypothetical protein
MPKQIVIEVPEGLEEKFITKFEEAIRKVELIVFAEILKDILGKSKLTEEKAGEISDEIKENIFKRYEANLGH